MKPSLVKLRVDRWRLCREILTAILYSLAEQNTERVNDAGGGGAVHTSTERQQEASLDTKNRRKRLELC